MKEAKRIPISKCKEIATDLGYDEVIIVGCHYASGVQSVATYGKSQVACANAALGGNAVKKLLKWPEDKCNAKPARQVRKEKQMWSDDDMVRYASKCYFNREDGVAFSDLLSEYKKENNNQGENPERSVAPDSK